MDQLDRLEEEKTNTPETLEGNSGRARLTLKRSAGAGAIGNTGLPVALPADQNQSASSEDSQFGYTRHREEIFRNSDRRLEQTQDTRDASLPDLVTRTRNILRQHPGYGDMSEATRNTLIEQIAGREVDSYNEQAKARHQAGFPRSTTIKTIKDNILWFGPIMPFVFDPEVEDIVSNGPDAILINKGHGWEDTPARFDDAEHMIAVINLMLKKNNRVIDQKKPRVNAFIVVTHPDNPAQRVILRLKALIPPITIEGKPSFTIRRMRETAFTPQELIDLGAVSEDAMIALDKLVKGRANIAIVGPTGSGKSAMLRTLIDSFEPLERIVTIEDTLELGLNLGGRARYATCLETLEGDIEGRDEITIDDLVQDSLRMRSDRLIIGECRGKEAAQVLGAMDTGHPGTLLTYHADTAEEALPRLEQMVAKAADGTPYETIKETIGRSVDIIVHVARRAEDHRRVVTKILEVTEYLRPEDRPLGYLGKKGYNIRSLWMYSDQTSTLERTQYRISGALLAKLKRHGLKEDDLQRETSLLSGQDAPTSSES